jgi:WD40 repeat protein
VYVFRCGGGGDGGGGGTRGDCQGYVLTFATTSVRHAATVTACALQPLAPPVAGVGFGGGGFGSGGGFGGGGGATFLLVSASDDGTVCARVIREGAAALEEEGAGASPPFAAHEGGVSSLLVLEGGLALVTGGARGEMRSWRRGAHFGPWRCTWQAREHTDWVTALQLVGNKLVSGGQDHAIRVWAAVAGGPPAGGGGGGGGQVWACERALEGHHGSVCALAQLRGKLLSASRDHSLRVWS